MSQAMQLTFHLFGPYKGQTMSINGHRFKNGVCVLVLASAAIAPCARVMGFYGAYAKGTPEYDKAVAIQEAEDGGSEISTSGGRGRPDQVQDDVRPNGSEPASQATDDGGGAVSSETETSGVDTTGYRYTDAGVPKFEERTNTSKPAEPQTAIDSDVLAAVRKLDPDNDSHWVQTGADKGKPKLSAVEIAYGKAGLTRKDIESAATGWTRSQAIDAALGAEFA